MSSGTITGTRTTSSPRIRLLNDNQDPHFDFEMSEQKSYLNSSETPKDDHSIRNEVVRNISRINKTLDL